MLLASPLFNAGLLRVAFPSQIGVLRLQRSLMNRPRNRQSRGQKQHQANPSTATRTVPARNAYPAHVPSIQQVTQGASVSIILKQDQPTGRQVSGIVQDVLTRGNHPRGIKVRLTDGRVGRVQSMMSQHGRQSNSQNPGTVSTELGNRIAMPPARSLADYFPDEPLLPAQQSAPDHLDAVGTCPICNDFHGDEVAVSRHVETHFTGDQGS